LPLKILFVVDSGDKLTTADPWHMDGVEPYRIRAIRSILEEYLDSPMVSFALLRAGTQPSLVTGRDLDGDAGADEFFTKDRWNLERGLAQLSDLDYVSDIQGALQMAWGLLAYEAPVPGEDPEEPSEVAVIVFLAGLPEPVWGYGSTNSKENILKATQEIMDLQAEFPSQSITLSTALLTTELDDQERAQAVELIAQMAEIGGGAHQAFRMPGDINFYPMLP
jgi:hypothetical protein